MIYENILELAKKQGLSISKLEKLAGLSKGAISKWKTSSPNVNNLAAVAKVLKVKLEVLTK